MPVNSTGQGHSGYTLIKQEAFRYFMEVHAKIICRIFAQKKPYVDRCYYYIDTNAGKGYNDDGSPGSIMIAVDTLGDTLSRNQYDFLITAIEKNATAAQMLRYALEQTCEDWSVIARDNAMALTSDLIPDEPDDTRYGLVYCDPNDMKGLPFDALTTFFQASQPQTQKMDLLINLSATTLKRVQGAHYTWYTIPDIIGKVNKNYWYIREGYDRAQWTFLFGTNWPDWPPLRLKTSRQKLGLYPIDSSEGRSLLEKLSLTSAAYDHKQQPQMPLGPPAAPKPPQQWRLL